MSLFKVQITYLTAKGEGARATCVVCANSNEDAELQGKLAIKASSRQGVQEFRAVVVTRNTLGVEFLGAQPS